MNNELVLDPEVYFIAGTFMLFLSFVMFMVLLIRLRRLNKRYKKLMNGHTGADVEQLVIAIQEKLNELRSKSGTYEKMMESIRQDAKARKSRVEMLRYNAFNQGGSDMSFSIAILNDYMDGVVLTGIHSREQTFMYAKPVEKGESKYTLSPEEKQVVDRAAAAKEGES